MSARLSGSVLCTRMVFPTSAYRTYSEFSAAREE